MANRKGDVPLCGHLRPWALPGTASALFRALSAARGSSSGAAPTAPRTTPETGRNGPIQGTFWPECAPGGHLPQRGGGCKISDPISGSRHTPLDTPNYPRSQPNTGHFMPETGSLRPVAAGPRRCPPPLRKRSWMGCYFPRRPCHPGAHQPPCHTIYTHIHMNSFYP